MTVLRKVWITFVVIVLAPLIFYFGFLKFAVREMIAMWKEE